MRLAALALLLTFACSASAEEITVPGIEQPVEILRDRWGVPHIYAKTSHDLFFAQGWMAARDRLFQIDLWRRAGSGKLAEVLGPSVLNRDRIARLVRFRGDWNAEWQSYSPDTRQIVTAFVDGINAYIRSLGGKRPLEFRLAGYDPGLWAPEDVVSRIAGLNMTRNVSREVGRAEDIRQFTLETVQTYLPPDPFVKIELPKGLSLEGITGAILGDYNAAIGSVQVPAIEGSNNWVVTGARSVTGKPLLANDPHRPIKIPSLRKTVHLVGPGWNAIGAGEPGLPGIALGHNEEVGFGFTIVNTDQADLYVEKLDPLDPQLYEYKGQWRRMEVVREQVAVKGFRTPRTVELMYTVHGPVISQDLGRHRAYALKWVGSEPGAAGYLAGLALARAKNWTEFQDAAARFKVPSENLVYADRAGNIGWVVAGEAPVRPNWSGLLPVPGSGEYEWSGFLPASELPRLFNPPNGQIVTANQNILPPGYPHVLGFEWSQPYRWGRIEEILLDKAEYSVADFEAMQQDVLSHPARIFRAVVLNWQVRRSDLSPLEWDVLQRMKEWDCRMTMDSAEASVFEMWIGGFQRRVFGSALGRRTELPVLFDSVLRKPRPDALRESLKDTVAELQRRFGPKIDGWQWGKLHHVSFRHPLSKKEFDRVPLSRPGDGNTVNATGGTNFNQTSGASFREILDVSDWDKSVMTNVPGESGEPGSPHYDDLLQEWAEGGYHPMVYSRKAVEAATEERIELRPAKP